MTEQEFEKVIKKCEVCKTPINHENWGETENRRTSDYPDGEQWNFMYLCRPCKSNGYELVRGSIRVWRSSPADADQPGYSYEYVKGLNPFEPSDRPVSSSGAATSRGYALRNYYTGKGKRR